MSHRQLNDLDRLQIADLLFQGYSQRTIGRILGFDNSTISRESKRNPTKGKYDPRRAQQKARNRRKCSKYQGMKVENNSLLRAYVITALKAYHTPEIIAGRIKAVDTHIPSVSTKSIYAWLHSAFGQAYCQYLPSKRYSPKKRKEKKKKREMIPQRKSIAERPYEANNRTEYGHCEEDTIVSGKRHHSTASLAVLEERTTRISSLQKIHNLQPITHRKAVRKMVRKIFNVRSITFDNGIENKEHYLLAKETGITTYFCDPYCSWQKGAIENTNGRIRRFIPKGANIAHYSDEDIAAIEHWLNHTPRKCLNYRTPYEMMLLQSSISSPPSVAFQG